MVTQKDTYPGGNAFDGKGDPLATQDFVFSTYQHAPPEALADKVKADITTELATGEKLMTDGKDAEANTHFAAVVDIAAQADPKTLGADEWFAVGLAHCYLMAAAFDKAVQAGGLGKEREQAARGWRDLVYAPPEAQVEKVRIIGHGEQVNLADYIVKGKTTIVDFFSEFCPPCRAIGPKLEALAGRRDDIYVVKVDINRPGVQGIDWQSPAARQFGLQAIPNFQVYGPDGKLQAEGDAAYQMVIGWLQ
jgi:thioredoxin 1